MATMSLTLSTKKHVLFKAINHIPGPVHHMAVGNE
jgi:hypothetical protein